MYDFYLCLCDDPRLVFIFWFFLIHFKCHKIYDIIILHQKPTNAIAKYLFSLPQFHKAKQPTASTPSNKHFLYDPFCYFFCIIKP